MQIMAFEAILSCANIFFFSKETENVLKTHIASYFHAFPKNLSWTKFPAEYTALFAKAFASSLHPLFQKNPKRWYLYSDSALLS